MDGETYDEVVQRARLKLEASLRKERERERAVGKVCPTCGRPYSIHVGDNVDYWGEIEKQNVSR